MTKVSANTFARDYKKRIQLGKTFHRFPDFINRKYFTLILKTMILTELVNCVTGLEIFTIQKEPPEVLLKFKSIFHKIDRKSPMPVPLFLNKVAGLRRATLLKNIFRHRCFPVNFVLFLRIPFWKATVLENMKAFKLQVTGCMKLKMGWIHITIKVRYRKTSKNKVMGLHFSEAFLWANMPVSGLSRLMCLG